MSRFLHIILTAFLTLAAAASISAAPDLPPGVYGVPYTHLKGRFKTVRSVLQVIRGTACKLEVDPDREGALRCTEEVSIASVDKRDGIAIVKNKKNIFEVDVKYCEGECSGDVLSLIQPIEGYEFHRRSEFWGTVGLRRASASEGKKNSDLPFEFKTATIQACIAKEDEEYDLPNLQLAVPRNKKYIVKDRTILARAGPTDEPKVYYMEFDTKTQEVRVILAADQKMECEQHLDLVLKKNGSVKIEKDSKSARNSRHVIAILCSEVRLKGILKTPSKRFLQKSEILWEIDEKGERAREKRTAYLEENAQDRNAFREQIIKETEWYDIHEQIKNKDWKRPRR